MTVLDHFYDAVASGTAESWMAAHPGEVTAVNANTAQEDGHRYLKAGDAGGATIRYFAASVLFTGCHLEEDAMHALLYATNVSYLAAETPEQYRPVRERLIQIAEVCAVQGWSALESEARITAADCSWWALQTFAAIAERDEQIKEHDDALTRQTLGDVVAAWHAVNRSTSAAQVERLSTLSMSVFRVYLDGRPDLDIDDDVFAAVSDVFEAVQRWLPPDAFSGPNAARVRANLAALLARIANRLETPFSEDLAGRLFHAMELAAEQEDDDSWATACRAVLLFGVQSMPAETMTELRQAFYAAQDPRSGYRSRLGRLTRAADLDELVGQDLSNLVAADNPDVAQIFQLTETASARTLLDGITGHLTIPDDKQCRELEREATSFPPADDDRVSREMRLLSQLPIGNAGRLMELEERYTQLGAGYADEAAPLGLADVQARLRKGQVLIRYVLPYRWSHPAYLPSAVVVTSTDARFVPLPVPQVIEGGFVGRITTDGRSPIDTSPLGIATFNTRAALTGVSPTAAEKAHEYLAQLDTLLLAPVRATGLTEGCDHWIISPQRSLHLVPWMALHDADGHWLVDDAAVTLAPSASVWAALQRPAGTSQRRLCVLGDPLVGYAGLPQLPGALAEAEQVTAAWETKARSVVHLPQAEATFPALAREARAAEVLHIAAHGSFPDDGALFNHRLMLSPDLNHAGPVTADELRTTDLSSAESTVLSICDGGAFRMGPGDEPYGLVAALLEAGTQTVVAAQWAVDDDRARALMSRTGELLVELPAAEALRQATREQRDLAPSGDWTHAAFVCIGGTTQT